DVSLIQGSYESGAALAAELQSRINSNTELSVAGASVLVQFTEDNRLQISSNRYGNTSSVAITGVDATTTDSLGLSVAAGTDGVDAVGTIGGNAASADGQVLSGAEGTDTEGLVVTVTGGNLGARGSINVSQGIAVRLTSLLEGALQSNGLLSSRSDGIQNSVDRLSDEREALNRRLEALEERYRRQFNALDTLLASISTTGNFLTQQLANIPVPGANNNS
ncbi:MAG: flagellar filament capping protein FliD, partial [Pseudomonadota bacterium]